MRIASEAIWHGGECTWSVVTTDPADPAGLQPMLRPAGGDLYQGTAGIALFLAELWALTQDKALLSVVHGAARRTAAEMTSSSSHKIGFFAGNTGAAYLFGRLGTLLGDGQYIDLMRDAVSHVTEAKERDLGLDVIAGSAGAIPVLLYLGQLTEEPGLVSMASEMGELLVRRARRGPRGWWWGGRDGFCRGGLAGLAHGAAGFGYSLLELYSVSGDPRYLFASEQAFLYEESLYDDKERNWLDLRNPILGKYFTEPDGIVRLQQRLRAGEPAPSHIYRCMSAWCHGAPGIGLTRLRAFQLLGEPKLRDEAMVAVATTSESLEQQNNCSICHGLAGNAETLLMASEVLSEPSWAERARAVVSEKLEWWGSDAAKWPSGSTRATPCPSLMLGNAGLGYLLLRLHSSSVPRIALLSCSSVVNRPPAKDAVEYREIGGEYTSRYLARTMGVFGRLVPEFTSMGLPQANSEGGIRLSIAFDEIRRRIALEADPLIKALLVDAASPEIALYEAALSLTDLTDEALDQIARLTAEEVDWDEAHFLRAAHIAVVECAYDWDQWMGRQTSDLPQPADGGVPFLVFRSAQEMHLRRIGGFASEVLRLLHHRASVDEVARGLAIQSDHSVDDQQSWRQRVLRQMRAMYDAGLIETAEFAERKSWSTARVLAQ